MCGRNSGKRQFGSVPLIAYRQLASENSVVRAMSIMNLMLPDVIGPDRGQ
jgi:hypothetical protein